MRNLTKIKEEFLYKIWESDILNKKLKSETGDVIEIINKGANIDKDDGPDFKNAKVRINGITYVGDIEIDSTQSDWIHHGHNLNKKFNKVVLHLFAIKDSKRIIPYVESGRKVESVFVFDFLDQNIRETLQKTIENKVEEKLFFLPCKELLHNFSERDKLEYLKHLGIKRFEKKCTKFYHRLREIKHEESLKKSGMHEPLIKYSLDESFYNSELVSTEFKQEYYWQQLFYENLFEALGYTKNKDVFRQLAQEVNLNFVKHFSPKEEFLKYAEFIYFKVAGFVPDVDKVKEEKSINYINEISDYWKIVGHSFEGILLHQEKWHFQQIRPQNFPTIRLAGGIRLIKLLFFENLLGKIFSAFEKIENSLQLINSLKSLIIVKADGFWKHHYHFDKSCNNSINYFIGNSRSEEIILNVILPFLRVFYQVFDNKKMIHKVDTIYRTLNQNTENQLVQELSESLYLNKFQHISIFQQGMIELFRDYCSKKRCHECKIGEKVFS